MALPAVNQSTPPPLPLAVEPASATSPPPAPRWPLLVDLSVAECQRTLRSLDLHAYSAVLAALRARGDLNPPRRATLVALRDALCISADRHRAEVRRVLNDEQLTTVAFRLFGSDRAPEWHEECRRLAVPYSSSSSAASTSTTPPSAAASAAARERETYALRHQSASLRHLANAVLELHEHLERSLPQPATLACHEADRDAFALPVPVAPSASAAEPDTAAAVNGTGSAEANSIADPVLSPAEDRVANSAKNGSTAVSNSEVEGAGGESDKNGTTAVEPPAISKAAMKRRIDSLLEEARKRTLSKATLENGVPLETEQSGGGGGHERHHRHHHTHRHYRHRQHSGTSREREDHHSPASRSNGLGLPSTAACSAVKPESQPVPPVTLPGGLPLPLGMPLDILSAAAALAVAPPGPKKRGRKKKIPDPPPPEMSIATQLAAAAAAAAASGLDLTEQARRAAALVADTLRMNSTKGQSVKQPLVFNMMRGAPPQRDQQGLPIQAAAANDVFEGAAPKRARIAGAGAPHINAPSDTTQNGIPSDGSPVPGQDRMHRRLPSLGLNAVDFTSQMEAQPIVSAMPTPAISGIGIAGPSFPSSNNSNSGGGQFLNPNDQPPRPLSAVSVTSDQTPPKRPPSQLSTVTNLSEHLSHQSQQQQQQQQQQQAQQQINSYLSPQNATVNLIQIGQPLVQTASMQQLQSGMNLMMPPGIRLAVVNNLTLPGGSLSLHQQFIPQPQFLVSSSGQISCKSINAVSGPDSHTQSVLPPNMFSQALAAGLQTMGTKPVASGAGNGPPGAADVILSASGGQPRIPPPVNNCAVLSGAPTPVPVPIRFSVVPLGPKNLPVPPNSLITPTVLPITPLRLMQPTNLVFNKLVPNSLSGPSVTLMDGSQAQNSFGLSIQQMPPRAIFVPGLGGSFSVMRPTFQPINIQAQQLPMQMPKLDVGPSTSGSGGVLHESFLPLPRVSSAADAAPPTRMETSDSGAAAATATRMATAEVPPASS